jgi:hypothetical protein
MALNQYCPHKLSSPHLQAFSRVEITEASGYRKQHAQDLSKHHMEAAQKYQAALE